MEHSEAAASTALPVSVEAYRRRVDDAIVAELDRRNDSPFSRPLLKAMQRGKRLRPILLVLAYESVGGHDVDPLPIAVAVELTHLESLIHDDILDHDALRRNATAFHVLHGYEGALLSADFILSLILDITTRYANRRVGTVLAKAVAEMCEGQLEELVACKEGRTLRPPDYVRIVSKKTAALFEASTTLGALVADADAAEIHALAEYGRLMGIAYQIHDDVLDCTASPTNQLLPLLTTNANLHALAASYQSEAKKRLGALKASRAKELLREILDFIAFP